MVEQARVQALNARPLAPHRRCLLYWMQASQRARHNHALEYAIAQGNELGLPVVVLFVLVDDYPDANLRHFQFMLQGLAQTRQTLAERGLLMVVRRTQARHVAATVVQVAQAAEASVVVCDRGYLRHQRRWRRDVTRTLGVAGVACVQVEADAVVPVDVASTRQELAARTLRPRIHRQLERFMVDLPAARVKRDSLALRLASDVDVDDVDGVLASLPIDRSVGPAAWARGGTSRAIARLQAFVRRELPRYGRQRGRVELDVVSRLSPYLHFGQISPVEVALRVQRARGAGAEAKQAFLEQLIVRRELALNFTERCPGYDRYAAAVPGWARRSLATHRRDRRERVYTRREMEESRTHDEAFNAAMAQMRDTGYLHNHLRMYWGKMILAWTRTPEHAYRTALALNNRYFLDGRDPASYTNVAWLFGLHDRPWPERPVFGKVRSMTRGGLEKKMDVGAYVAAVAGDSY